MTGKDILQKIQKLPHNEKIIIYENLLTKYNKYGLCELTDTEIMTYYNSSKILQEKLKQIK